MRKIAYVARVKHDKETELRYHLSKSVPTNALRHAGIQGLDAFVGSGYCIFTLDYKYLHHGYATAYISGAGGLKTLTIRIGSTEAEIKVQLPSAENGEEWHHLTLTQDNYAVKMYLNGKKVLSKVISAYYQSSDATTNKLILGTTRNIDGRYFHGSVDDVRFYSRALTECEVQHLYKN